VQRDDLGAAVHRDVIEPSSMKDAADAQRHRSADRKRISGFRRAVRIWNMKYRGERPLTSERANVRSTRV